MIPQIAGFITRAGAGLARPRSRRLITATAPVTVHWPGFDVRHRLHPDPERCGCWDEWRSIQHYHMTGRGFVDVAYTGAVCLAGHALAGRGKGVRTAANGTNQGNSLSHAILLLISPTDRYIPVEARAAAAWWVETLDDDGRRPIPHSQWKPTACPGDIVRDAITLDQFTPITTTEEYLKTVDASLKLDRINDRLTQLQQDVAGADRKISGNLDDRTDRTIRAVEHDIPNHLQALSQAIADLRKTMEDLRDTVTRVSIDLAAPDENPS